MKTLETISWLISPIVLTAVLLLNHDTRSQDEIIRDKIAIIETAKDNPTPEVVAMVESAKADLRELQAQKQSATEAKQETKIFLIIAFVFSVIITFAFLAFAWLVFRVLL